MRPNWIRIAMSTVRCNSPVWTNVEVARLLWISPATVRKHLENAYEKLEVHNRTGAVAALRAAGDGS